MGASLHYFLASELFAAVLAAGFAGATGLDFTMPGLIAFAAVLATFAETFFASERAEDFMFLGAASFATPIRAAFFLFASEFFETGASGWSSMSMKLPPPLPPLPSIVKEVEPPLPSPFPDFLAGHEVEKRLSLTALSLQLPFPLDPVRS